MDKVISSQHMRLINMGMVRRKYREFKDIHLRAIGINPNKEDNEKLAEFTDYYEEERHRSHKSYTVSQIAKYFDHYSTIENYISGKYTIFSDGERIYGIAGYLDKVPCTPKLYILGEGKMEEYPYATIELPYSDYWLLLWYTELVDSSQKEVSNPIAKYASDSTYNPDIYKHCVTKDDFKQFCQRCEMLEMLNI